MTEIKFWEAKCMNLESLYDQIKAPTTNKMASIMKSTDSAYYPVFRSMYKNVMAALDEALDITLFLKCLATHFQVRYLFLELKMTFCWRACQSLSHIPAFHINLFYRVYHIEMVVTKWL